MEKRYHSDAAGLASLTIIQALVEKLIASKALSKADAKAAFEQTIAMHSQIGMADEHGPNAGAAYLLEQYWADIDAKT